MPSFTREQLRSFTTNSADFTAISHTFSLENNSSTTAYFAIEGNRHYVNEPGVFVGHRYKDVFNSAKEETLLTKSCDFFVPASPDNIFLSPPNLFR